MRKRKRSTEQHPWEEWFAEEQLTLRKGRDFQCEPYIMAQQFRNKIKMYTRDRKDLTVSIWIDGLLLDLDIKEVD